MGFRDDLENPERFGDGYLSRFSGLIGNPCLPLQPCLMDKEFLAKTSTTVKRNLFKVNKLQVAKHIEISLCGVFFSMSHAVETPALNPCPGDIEGAMSR
jgi:hypothetical protein